MPYLGKQSEQVGVSIQKYEFLQATDTSSGTTSFSVPSDAGDHVNVWLNGVLLVEGASNDYTTTSTTVVFGTAPADGDIVRIDVVESFSLPDALKSSGDTMTGPLKLDGGLKQQTSQDLSGTYAYHQMMVSDAFTVAGDVTISDNLVLTKISDDSNAITLTDDGSTRTITGTGSLETSTIAQTPNSSLTGMTGEIGSAVIFPAGHVLQVKSMTDSSCTETASSSYIATTTTLAITPSSSSSKILILVHSAVRADGGSPQSKPEFTIYRGSTNLASYPMASVKAEGTNTSGHNSSVSMNWLDSPNTTSSTTYTVYMRDNAGRFCRWATDNPHQTVASMTLMEIAG